MRSLSALGAAVLVAAVAGCGGPKTTPVTGKVTYQGRTVVWGNVSVIASDNISYTAPIGLDGTFKFDKIPVGPCKIGLNSPSPEGAITNSTDPLAGGGVAEGTKEAHSFGGRVPQDTRPKPPPGAWFEISNQYMDPLTSGLTGEIKTGQPLDINVP